MLDTIFKCIKFGKSAKSQTTPDSRNALVTKTHITKNAPTEGEIEQLSSPGMIHGLSRRL